MEPRVTREAEVLFHDEAVTVKEPRAVAAQAPAGSLERISYSRIASLVADESEFLF